MEEVICVLSHAGSDVRCAVCGQGFLVYWSRLSRAQQTDCRRVIQVHLREHHTVHHDILADRRLHPRNPFPIPDWNRHAALVAQEEKIGMEEVA